MAPQGQSLIWAEVLCCAHCNKIFDEERHAVNLACSHSICRPCLLKMESHLCHHDQVSGDTRLEDLPTNKSLMDILGVETDGLAETKQEGVDSRILREIDFNLLEVSKYLRRAESERGGSVWSEVLSRSLQRKVVNLVCIQLAEPSGRVRASRIAKNIAERILSELLQTAVNNASVSSTLWSAVRARGCQFLGPAMQEDVLKIVLLALGKGALIARKTLVMYVVQTMHEDYPQVSKTCVGHVVQLLYRASCFNVLKRDGESSLMQLKEEFRVYDALRREHDAQIVGMALEAGLRISPEQWSSLLYGDQVHRSHMQSVIDKLQTPQTFACGIDELEKSTTAEKNPIVAFVCPVLRNFEDVNANNEAPVSWRELSQIIEWLGSTVAHYAEFITQRNDARSAIINNAVREGGRSRSFGGTAYERPRQPVQVMYKTRLCRDFVMSQPCSRGNRCSYAHDSSELREQTATQPIPQYQPIPCGSSMMMGGPRGMSAPSGGPFSMAPKRSITNVGPPMGMPMMNGPPPPMPQPTFSMGGMAAGLGRPHLPPLPARTQTPVMVAMRPPFGIPPQGGVILVQQGGPPPPVMETPGAPPMAVPPPPGVIMMHSQPSPVMIPFWSPTAPVPHTASQQMTWLPHTDAGGLDNGWGKSSLTGRPSISHDDSESLQMRRLEILKQLDYISFPDLDDLNDDSHVSYTVASSVLDDRMADNYGNIVAPPLELPAMPVGYTPVINSITTSEEAIGALSDLAIGENSPSRILTYSHGHANSNTVRTMVPAYSFSTPDCVTTATVQADSTTMHVRESISDPVSTPIIVPVGPPMALPPPIPMAAPLLPIAAPFPPPFPMEMALDGRIPMVIQPLHCITPSAAQIEHPADIVSNTLDRIVDVKEKMTEVDGAASTVVKSQLEVELEIANRQIEQLDPATAQDCLLKELEAVDRKIEEMEPLRQGDYERMPHYAVEGPWFRGAAPIPSSVHAAN